MKHDNPNFSGNYQKHHKILAIAMGLGMLASSCRALDNNEVISAQIVAAVEASRLVRAQALGASVFNYVDQSEIYAANYMDKSKNPLNSKQQESCELVPETSLDSRYNLATVDGMIAFHNFIRETVGLRDLFESDALNQSAQDTADFLAANSVFEHVNKPGQAGLSHAGEALPDWLKLGENIGLGKIDDPIYDAKVAACWLQSDSHAETFLDPEYQVIGVGMSEYASGSDLEGRKVIVVQFGQILP